MPKVPSRIKLKIRFRSKKNSTNLYLFRVVGAVRLVLMQHHHHFQLDLSRSDPICVQNRWIVCNPSFSNRRANLHCEGMKLKEEKTSHLTFIHCNYQIIWIWKFQFAAGIFIHFQFTQLMLDRSFSFIHHEVSIGNVWFLLCLYFFDFLLRLVWSMLSNPIQTMLYTMEHASIGSSLAWHFDSVFICRSVDRAFVWSANLKVFFFNDLRLTWLDSAYLLVKLVGVEWPLYFYCHLDCLCVSMYEKRLPGF